jgi:hypothetical protein
MLNSSMMGTRNRTGLEILHLLPQNDCLTDVLKLPEEFTKLPDTESTYREFGSAGEFIDYSIEHDEKESVQAGRKRSEICGRIASATRRARFFPPIYKAQRFGPTGATADSAANPCR